MNLVHPQVYSEEDRVAFFSGAARTAFLKARVTTATCEIPITLLLMCKETGVCQE